MKGPTKLCMSCMREIPLFAGRCPYCIDENQGVHGRFMIVLLLVIGLILFAHWYVKETNNVNANKQIEQSLVNELENSKIFHR